MFKKLNQKLLSKYPLLWNTRIIYVLPAAILIHVLFYLVGFFTDFELSDLHNYRLFRDEDVILYSTLVTIVIVILWLVFYLRNNPFKSYYTLSKNYMFKEFLLIAIIFISSSTFFFSHKQGFYDRVTLKTHEINAAEEANLINLASHFIAFSIQDFDLYNCCDSIKARERRDSIRSAHIQSKIYSEEPPPYEQRIRGHDSEYPNSYLYYCQNKVDLYSSYIKDQFEISAIARHWLINNETDSVYQVLTELVQLCKKYGINYYFDPLQQVHECFSDSNFAVHYVVSSYVSDYDHELARYKSFYININELEESLHKLERVRRGFWDIKILVAWLYCVLAAAVVLFSFRVTRLKHWFIALLGLGLWMILIGLVEVSFRLDDDLIILIVFLWAVLFFVMANLIQTKSKKLFAGIIYNWIFWLAGFIIPLIIIRLDVIGRRNCYDYGYYGYEKLNQAITPACKMHYWIDHNWLLINVANIIIGLLLIYFVFIPLARKWQSNPEE